MFGFGASKKATADEATSPTGSEGKKRDKKIIDPHYVYLDDEPEVDYDLGVTQLYKFIEDKQWDKAISRIDTHPHEARTWIFRRESSNPKKIRW